MLQFCADSCATSLPQNSSDKSRKKSFIKLSCGLYSTRYPMIPSLQTTLYPQDSSIKELFQVWEIVVCTEKLWFAKQPCPALLGAVSLAQSHRKSSVMAGWCAAVPLEAWMQLLLTVEVVPTLGEGHCASSFTSTSDLYSSSRSSRSSRLLVIHGGALVNCPGTWQGTFMKMAALLIGSRLRGW